MALGSSAAAFALVLLAAAQAPSESPAAKDTRLAPSNALLEDARAALEAKDFAGARALIATAIDRALADIGSRADAPALELLDRMGNLAHNASELRAAERARRRVLEARTRTLPDDHPDLQQARQRLGVSLFLLRDLLGARTLFEKVLEVRSRTLPDDDDDDDLQRIRQNLGSAMRELGDLAGARALDEKVYEVWSRTLPDDHLDLQKARQALGLTLRLAGDLPGALALEKKVLEVRSRVLPDDHPDLQAARGNLAITLQALGDLEGARALQAKVVEVHSRALPEDHPYLLNAQANLAVLLGELGDFAASRAIEEKVLEIRSRQLPEDHDDVQAARLNLASTIQRLGDLAGARALLERVLEVRSRNLPDDHPDLLLARQNLGVTLFRLGDRKGARQLHEKVLEVRSRILPDDHPDLQRARANLASTIKELGDRSGARELEEKVLEVWSRTLPDDHPDLQKARQGLAVTLFSVGDFERAREFQEKVLEMLARTPSEGAVDLRMARGNLCATIAASAHSASGDEGEEARRRCLELQEAQLRGDTDLARAALLTGSPREAEARCQTLQHDLNCGLSFAEGMSVLPRCPELEGPCFVLSETTRGAALGSAALRRLAARSPLYAELREDLEGRSRELAGLTSKGTTSEEFGRALGRREEVERRLTSLARELAGGAPPGLEIDVDALAARLPQHAAVIAYRRYWRHDIRVPESDAGSPFDPPVQSAVDSLCASVLRRGADGDGILTRSDLGPIARIEEAVRAWRESIDAGAQRGLSSSSGQTELALSRGRALCALVLDPLRGALGDAQHLVVVLDDVLHLVPLDALPMDEAESDPSALVGDRWRLDVRCTTAELLAPPAPRVDGALVALGGAAFNSEPLGPDEEDVAKTTDAAEATPAVAPNPRGGAWDRGFTPLTYTGLEAREIAAMHDETAGEDARSVVLEKRKASREALEELAPRARWLHVATHGWFAPESIRSWHDEEPLDLRSGLGMRLPGEEQVRGMSPMLLCGLALAGANLPEDAVGRAPGLITAEEMSTLDLARCELAVLSACDTNVGERRAGQGVASLQRALQMAGARSVITSLWKVPDEATRELMTDFYRRLWVEKKPKWRALWEAKKKLREAKDESGGPRYSTRDWGAWVLTGEPD